jgi:hypothetical protein
LNALEKVQLRRQGIRSPVPAAAGTGLPGEGAAGKEAQSGGRGSGLAVQAAEICVKWKELPG